MQPLTLCEVVFIDLLIISRMWMYVNDIIKHIPFKVALGYVIFTEYLCIFYNSCYNIGIASL